MSVSFRFSRWNLAVFTAMAFLVVSPRAAAAEAATKPAPPQNPRRIHRLFGEGPRAEVTPHLNYYGGPVVHTGVAYTIYWLPPGTFMSAGYQSTLNQYFLDIGDTSFYNILTQYPDNAGLPQNVSTFGGTWVDTRPYPHAGTFADALIDSDIQTEVLHAIAANPGWNPPGPETMYYVMTARNIYSCFDGSHSTCSYRQYCAYHSSFQSGGATVLYADIPYLTHGIGCDAGGVPPGDPDAEVTMSALSHEHFEIANDGGPALAWYDPNFDEIADICAYNYGAIGPNNVNLTLHGHTYKIQTMWSNADNACVLSYDPPALTALEAKNTSPNQLGTLTRLTATPTGGGASISYQWNFGDGASSGSSTSRIATHTYASGGTYTAQVTATNGTGSAQATTTVYIVTNQSFSIAAAPPSQTVRKGSSTSFAVSTTDINGFPAPITIIFSGMPAGASYSCLPKSVSAGGGTSCTVHSGSAAAGTYSVNIVGSAGTVSHFTTVSLSIVPCAGDGECDDAAFCNGAETCSSGTCVIGLPANCDDANACTDDACSATAGGCVHTSVVPAEIDGSVRLGKAPGEATIEWSDTPGPYNVYRGTIAAGSPFGYDHACFAPGVAATSASDPADPSAGALSYYLVTRLGTCGESIPGKDSAAAAIPNPSPCP